MRLKSYVFLCFILLFNSGFASKVHVHPQNNANLNKKAVKNWMGPEACEIEVINHSFQTVEVFGFFDDGVRIKFNIFPNDLPHYISLDYDCYCHRGMFLDIKTLHGRLIYSGYSSMGSTLEIVSYASKQLKATVHVSR